MTEISDRLFRVAALGVVPADDQHVIADANAEIEQLRAALQCIADFEQDIYVKDVDALSYMRETAKSALGPR